MRLFVGIAITEEIRSTLEAYVHKLHREVPPNPLGNYIKWVKPESFHLTLKFIGESQQLREIEEDLGSITAADFEMTFRGVGFFSQRSPRVFWAGVNAGPELERLASRIDDSLYGVGVPKEPHAYQEYQPHITLARVGSGRPQGSPRDRNKPTMWAMKYLKDFVSAQPPPEFGTMTAEEFILFQSETLPSGSRYTPLKRFPLKSPS
jgi:2'-5' RNA ligase